MEHLKLVLTITELLGEEIGHHPCMAPVAVGKPM